MIRSAKFLLAQPMQQATVELLILFRQRLLTGDMLLEICAFLADYLQVNHPRMLNGRLVKLLARHYVRWV